MSNPISGPYGNNEAGASGSANGQIGPVTPYGQPQPSAENLPYGQNAGATAQDGTAGYTAPNSPYGNQPGYEQSVYGQPAYGQPAYGQQPYGTAPVLSEKSRIVAGVLGLFFGFLGVHNFYAGYTTRGVIQLVGTLVGWLLSILIIGLFVVAAIGIWAFVESILFLCGSGTYAYDSNGYLLRS